MKCSNKDNTPQRVCRFLSRYHTGMNNAASSKTLEAAFHIRGSELRRIVNTLRCDGFPICSDKNGYYYAACESEIHATVAQLNSRISKISGAKDGMLSHTDKSKIQK